VEITFALFSFLFIAFIFIYFILLLFYFIYFVLYLFYFIFIYCIFFYFNRIGGIFVASLGHGHPKLLEALHKQSKELTFAPPLHGLFIISYF
jgi:hypothetical protein